MVRIVDDALPPRFYSKLRSMVDSPDMPWYLGRTASDQEEHFSFSCVQVDRSAILWDITEDTMLLFWDFADINVKENVRMRYGLIMRDGESIINEAHVDWEFPHTTALFYINDSDGDTYIYNEKYDPKSGIDTRDYMMKNLGGQDNLTVMEKVTPKANRLVLFDGLHYHASSTPTKSPYRIALNSNFIEM